MIDKAYYKANMPLYYRDFLIPLAVLLASLAWSFAGSGPSAVAAWLALAALRGHLKNTL